MIRTMGHRQRASAVAALRKTANDIEAGQDRVLYFWQTPEDSGLSDFAEAYGTISDELNELHEYPALSQLPEEYNWGIAVIVEEGRAAGPDNNDNNIMFELVPAVKVKGGTE